MFTALFIIIAMHSVAVDAEELEPQVNQQSKPSPSTPNDPQIENLQHESYAEVGIIDQMLNVVDDQHQVLSEQLVGFTEKIDTFFISDDQEERINYTHIQLGYRYTQYKDNISVLEPILSTKIHLPRTQNRLTLEVSNKSLFDLVNNTAQAGSTNPVEKDPTDLGFNFGLGYAREISDFFNAKVTGGGKLSGNKFNVFINLQLYRKFFFNKWSLHLSEDLFRDTIIYSRSTAQMLFERNVSEDKLFRSISKNITYFDLGYSQNHQTFYVLQQLSSRDAIIYQVGSMWEKPLNLLSYDLENYYALVRYSRKIYRDWLFMEVSPQVQFLKSEDFHAKPLIVLQFSAFFGNNK
jgi:hypothetical protein